MVFSAFGSRCSTGVSLQVGHSLNAIVTLVFVDDRDRLVVANVAVKSFEFRVVAVCVLSSVGKRHSFLQWLVPFLDNLKWLVLVGDWDAILDHKLDKARLGASGSDRCESSLIDLQAKHDLVNRFCLEMWTWLNNLPSGQIQAYLDRVLEELAVIPLCPMFHWIGQTDHKLVRVSLQRANRPCLASYCKFPTFLQEI